jgi:hypothetical protein
MKKLSKWLHKVSTGWVTGAAVIIFFVFMATVLPQQAAKAEETSRGADSPDTSFYYSAGDLYKMAENYGKDGRKAYIQARFSFDIVFPLVYAAFLGTSISWITQRGFPKHSQWQLANLAPVFGMGFDFLENISTSMVMARFPAQTPVAGWLAPIFTLVKWVFVYGSFVLLLIGIIVAVWDWAKGKTSGNPQGTG